MSGHSKWNNIQAKKSKADEKYLPNLEENYW